MSNRYHVNVFWSESDRCWVADIPDLKSCAAFGDTPAEAVEEVERAAEAWLEAARDAGLPLPPARYRPAIYAAAE